MATINLHLESAICQTTCAQQEVANTVCPSGNKVIRVTTSAPQLPVQLGQPTASSSQRKQQAATHAALGHCSTAGLQCYGGKPANGTGQDKSAMLGSQPKQERQDKSAMLGSQPKQDRQAEACWVPSKPQPSPESQYQLIPHAALPGEYRVPDFVTEQEELDLLHMLDACLPLWQDKTFNGKHRCRCDADCVLSGIPHLACRFCDGVICSALYDTELYFCSNLLKKAPAMSSACRCHYGKKAASNAIPVHFSLSGCK